MQRQKVIGLAIVVSSLVLSACATDFTGGGFIQSTVGTGKATFGFVFHCTQLSGELCTAGQAQGNYSDPGAGVQFQFDQLLLSLGPTQFGNECFTGITGYRVAGSQSQPVGLVLVIACDLGQPGSLPRGNDFVVVDVLSGPYNGYTNQGVLLGGNLQAH